MLTQQIASHASGRPVKVFAQDETRLGLVPISRRRITACGVPPVGTVTQQFDNFYLYGAVAPPTGDSFFLERPDLNSSTFQLWLAGFRAACPDACQIVVLDNGTFHKAKAVPWPSNVVPLFLPPYSPERNPIERRWRDLKDPLADPVCNTLAALADAVGTIIQGYSVAALQSLTGVDDFVQAVKTARHAYV